LDHAGETIAFLQLTAIDICCANMIFVGRIKWQEGRDLDAGTTPAGGQLLYFDDRQFHRLPVYNT
jgi:hypothetical protein